MVEVVPRPLASACLALVLVCGAAGCGGSGEPGKKGERDAGCAKLSSEGQREECERAEAAKGIPAVDRVAYYQLATTAGLLRGRAVAANRGEPQPPNAGATELRAARSRVLGTRPADKGLKRLRLRMLALLRTEAGGLSPAEAGAILVKLSGVSRALNAFLKHRPGQAALVPD